MKKLFIAAFAAILAVGAGLHADAADRIFKGQKIFKVTYSGVAADAMLPDSTGKNYLYIGDINPNRIVIENNLTSISGTSVIIKAVTTSDPTNAGATTDAVLVGSDGSTAVAVASQTATGIKSYGASTRNTGDAPDCSNLGTYIGVWADVSSATVGGTVTIYVQGDL